MRHTASLVIAMAMIGCVNQQKYVHAVNDCYTSNLAAECRKAGIWAGRLNKTDDSVKFLKKSCEGNDESGCRLLKQKYPQKYEEYVALKVRDDECVQQLGDEFDSEVTFLSNLSGNCSIKRDGYFGFPVVYLDKKTKSKQYATISSKINYSAANPLSALAGNAVMRK